MAPRHKWLKLKLHHYICLRCGALKENRLEAGAWRAWFTLPDGTPAAPRRYTPACEPGPDTDKLLASASEISGESGGLR